MPCLLPACCNTAYVLTTLLPILQHVHSIPADLHHLGGLDTHAYSFFLIFLVLLVLLQEKFDWAGGGVEAEKPILSYGPCQFPTLGLIVQRAWWEHVHSTYSKV